MSISLYTDTQLFTFLENSKKLFDVLGLKLSAKIIGEIITDIQKSIPKIDVQTISGKFVTLQDSVDVEFCKKSAYHKKIFLHLQEDYRYSTKVYQTKVNQLMNSNFKVDMMEKRSHSHRNLEILKNAILRHDPTLEEKFVGISFAYLAMVDGPYKLSLQECYLWHRIAKNEEINIRNILESDPAQIYDHFKQEKIGLEYFEGWDKIVRNAVGHSSFKFDEAKQKMIYEDMDKKSGKNKIIEYDYEELAQNFYKLEALYHAIFAIGHISLVNGISFEFTQRYK